MWTALNRSGEAERTLELLLRIGVAGCFIGHGAFGVIGKSAWLPYFAAVGIGDELAWTLMPVVGTIDILVGIVALLSPRPVVLLYAAFWALWTAALRPLAGESFFETLERAGNYGIPVALMVLAGVRMDWSTKWLRPLQIGRLTEDGGLLLRRVLQWTAALLLIGHGGLALSGKPLLVDHLALLGVPADGVYVLGAVEMAMAVAVLARPAAPLLLLILGWKLATEALFPLSGAPFWEFVERAGSYIAPLALWTMVRSVAPVVRSERQLARDTAIVLLAALVSGGAVGTPSALGTPAAWGTPSTVGTPSTAGGTGGLTDSRSGMAEILGQSALLDQLREGGHVLACRHASTDRSRGDARQVDFDDPSTQRVLSAAGRRQAERLGEAIRGLEIPIGQVLASPYDRALETARLAFGRADVERPLMARRARGNSDLARLFRSDPQPGTNRVLVSHQWVLYPMLPSVESGSIREGDCMVLLPQEEGEPAVLGRYGPDDWAGLRGGGGRLEGESGLEGDSPMSAAVAGDATLLCRHAATTGFREVEPVDYDDPESQRRLSGEGEDQARAMGRAMARRGVRFSEVIASPMERAFRTAELMAGRRAMIQPIWHTNGGSYRGEPLRARREALARSPGAGTRLIVSHIGTIASTVPEARGQMEEGDCAVLEGGADQARLLGFVSWERW